MLWSRDFAEGAVEQGLRRPTGSHEYSLGSGLLLAQASPCACSLLGHSFGVWRGEREREFVEYVMNGEQPITDDAAAMHCDGTALEMGYH